MEFFLRIADDKYLKNNVASTYEKATQMLLKDSLPFFLKFNEQSWRENKFWTE